MPDVHAKLSASGSHIWLNCPPSVKLSEGMPDQDTAFSKEGTVAHKLAEMLLSFEHGLITQEEFETGLEEVGKSEFYSEEMHSYISSYVDWVDEVYAYIQKTSADHEILTEQRLDFSKWVPGGFGTGDVVIIADGTLTVIDLKYGKGVPVSAENNPQLMLYGLGAFDAFSLSNDIRTVRMVINQPRLDAISEFEMSVEDLLKWGDTYVKPRAAAAMKGEGDANPGEWCRFCKCRAICKARAKAAEELGKYVQRDPELLTDEEIAKALTEAEVYMAWISDVKEYAQKEAEGGHKWPGWKLVEGRSNRKYADPKAVEEKLLAAGYDRIMLFKDPELLGLTAMEKVVGGKKKLEELLPGLIIKPQGAPTLVPETDKRPEISGADVYNDNYHD